MYNGRVYTQKHCDRMPSNSWGRHWCPTDMVADDGSVIRNHWGYCLSRSEECHKKEKEAAEAEAKFAKDAAENGPTDF